MPEQAFLDKIRSRGAGSLKLYIGMAAGVGKTYRMLQEARDLQRRGVDVLVGLAVTHGRADTVQMLDGLPQFPLRHSFYKGKEVEEFDLEGVLRRRPDLVLIDELAHTNVPGSKNEKRWQDVLDLLEAGINVLSAVNIQHIESLNGQVLRITGIDVAERVPDRVVQRADEVVNIDVPADELIQRMREGKIYKPERVEAALANFFKQENLLQLRELAMREVANRLENRIGVQVPKAQRNGTECIILAISTNDTTAKHMLRRVARIASFLDARWDVVYVQTSKESSDKISLAAQRHLINNFKLATELGARVVTLKEDNVAAALARHCQEQEATLMVVGKTRRSIWQTILYGDLVKQLLRLTEKTSTDILLVGI